MQEEIANRAVNTFHITVENGLISELTEWNGLVQKHLEDIRGAEQTRTTAHDTENRLHALQNEFTDKKNKRPKQSLFGGNREQELEDLQQRIAKASDVRTSLTAEYQKQKNSIAQAVKQLMEKRYIYFDRIYVQMLECQAEYFSHAANASKRFRKDIDYYRKQYPKTHEFQHSNGSYGSTSGSKRVSKSNTEKVDASSAGVSSPGKGGKKHTKSKAMVDFDGDSPPHKPSLPTSAPPSAPMSGDHHNGHYDTLPTGSLETSTTSSPGPDHKHPNMNGHAVSAVSPSSKGNGKGMSGLAVKTNITKSQSVPHGSGIPIIPKLDSPPETDSSTITMEAPRSGNHNDRQHSTHDLLDWAGMQEEPSQNHSQGQPSLMSSMFASEALVTGVTDEHGLWELANEKDNDMLDLTGNSTNNQQQQQQQTQQLPDHSDFWNDLHSNPAPMGHAQSTQSHQQHHSVDDPFGFLTESKSAQPPKHNAHHQTRQRAATTQNGLATSASRRTPPNGAQEEKISEIDKEKMNNYQLSKIGKENAEKAYREEMARREAEEKQEEQDRREREHWKDTHEQKLKAWEFEDGHSRRNVRTLIGKLPAVLPAEITNNPKINWKPIPIAKLLTDGQLKRGYFKAIRVVHPDKSSQRGDSIEAQVICDYVFQALDRAKKSESLNF